MDIAVPVSTPYVPVDTTYPAREKWPFTAFTTEDQLNARELGQFIAGFCWAQAMADQRAWKIVVPNDKVAAVVAALVDRSFCVAKESWSVIEPHTTLAVWSGL